MLPGLLLPTGPAPRRMSTSGRGCSPFRRSSSAQRLGTPLDPFHVTGTVFLPTGRHRALCVGLPGGVGGGLCLHVHSQWQGHVLGVSSPNFQG